MLNTDGFYGHLLLGVQTRHSIEVQKNVRDIVNLAIESNERRYKSVEEYLQQFEDIYEYLNVENIQAFRNNLNNFHFCVVENKIIVITSESVEFEEDGDYIVSFEFIIERDILDGTFTVTAGTVHNPLFDEKCETLMPCILCHMNI